MIESNPPAVDPTVLLRNAAENGLGDLLTIVNGHPIVWWASRGEGRSD